MALKVVGESDQEPVAVGVAVRVVDALEVVQIDEQHRAVRSVALGASDGAGEPLAQQRAVRQVCQRVVERHIGKFCLALLQIGNVDERSGAHRRSAALVERRANALANRADAAAGAQDPMVARVVFARVGILDDALDRIQVARMIESANVECVLVRPDAEYGAESGRNRNLAGGQIDRPGAETGLTFGICQRRGEEVRRHRLASIERAAVHADDAPVGRLQRFQLEPEDRVVCRGFERNGLTVERPAMGDDDHAVRFVMTPEIAHVNAAIHVTEAGEVT